MSDYFVKLHKKIVDSSIWNEAPATRVVFLTLLARADSDGIAQISRGSIARVANVTQEEAETALQVLQSPDQDSKTTEEEGRRVRQVDGGFLIINYQKHRGNIFQAPSDTPGAKRTRAWRERKKAEDETDGVTVTSPSISISKSISKNKKWRIVPDDWEPKQVHREKAQALGVDFEAELDKFRNWEYKQPKTDADRAFHTWLRNAKPTRAAKGGISWGIE